MLYQVFTTILKVATSRNFKEVNNIATSQPTTQNVLGKVDWLQIIFVNVQWRTVFSDVLLITPDCVTSETGSLKYEEYNVVYTCGSIRYYTTEDHGTRGTLVMSGQACTMYEWGMLASDTQQNVFQELALRIIELATNHAATFEVSRLDLALHDYNTKPFFGIDTIIGKVRRKQFLSKGRSAQLVDSEFDKRTRSKTQQIGSRGSDCIFRFYEKAKELAHSLSGVDREKMLDEAPRIRLEAETRHDTAKSLLMAIAYMTQEQTLSNLIRGFVKTELNFYTSTDYRTVSRWWINFLKPCFVPTIRRQKPRTDFDRSMYWFEHQGGFGFYNIWYW